MNKYGKRLKDLRRKKGLSQEELAKLLSTTRSRIANYEQGIREPDMEMQEALADFFNVTIDYLFGKTEISIEEQLALSATGSSNADEVREFIEFYNDFRKVSPEDRVSIRNLLKSLRSET